ncbi:MAG TPA: NAD(P)-binding domain-containing protein [Thermomicrobiales bacterium]|nr:NAD(P)-binding domain-containing protein [Thermomicrobiales bacterium]
MARVAILGAGDMGTALTTPLAANGHDVRLLGTHLDGEIVAALGGGHAHPRLGVTVAPNVRVFFADDWAEALGGAEVAVVAVTSDGVRPVVSALAEPLSRVPIVVTVAKGFDPGTASGDVLLLPEVIATYTDAPIVGVGGPSKANEVARGIPTAVVFGGPASATERSREIFATAAYKVETSTDLNGIEIAAAMKNAYAIALGVADGLEHRTGTPHHNLRAALFPRAVGEMGRLAEACGGRTETVAGLAGSGDLQVTITSGRNRLLGERIGRGESGGEAAASLRSAGITVEGYAATDFGYRLARRLGDGATGPGLDLPLLRGLWSILYENAPALETLWAAV